MTQVEIEKIVDRLVRQHVSVVEGDSDLSNYLTDDQFDREVRFIRRFADAAHRRGLRVVWYYPALEVLSAGAQGGKPSMFKDHPDWVQIGLDGKPNVFYGGEGRIHWVEKGTESAWMTLGSPYGDYFMARVEKLARSGVDGLWLDVPLLNDIAARWADMNPYARAKFTADTGLQPPTAENWSDPTWRRWIAWRHTNIASFLERVTRAARAADPDLVIVVENVTLDYNAATTIGLDGTHLKSTAGVIQAWEIDAISDADAMRRARHDDWIALIAMNKFAKGASGRKPSWVFAYGSRPDDARFVMAEVLAAGNHPYETRIPSMAETVGDDYRTRMFSWIKRNSRRLFDSESGAMVGVLFSTASRDYVDRGAGSGLYATVRKGEPLWWSDQEDESLYRQTYLAEQRGTVKWLVHEHIPFDVITRPTMGELSRYRVILAPALTAISDEAATLLKDFVADGGHLVVTGPRPLSQDEFGNPRERNALVDFPDGRGGDQLKGRRRFRIQKGVLTHIPFFIGKRYFNTTDSSARALLRDALGPAADALLTTDARPTVHIELRRLSNQTLIHLVDWTGVDRSFTVAATEVKIRFRLPDGAPLTDVVMSAPHVDGGAERRLPFTVAGRDIAFSVPMRGYALVTLLHGPADTKGFNDPPVAGKDVLRVESGREALLTGSLLLRNDGDLDDDPIELVRVERLPASVGEVVAGNKGTHWYVPPPRFVGADALRYTIADRHGAVDTASIRLDVVAPQRRYAPHQVDITAGTFDTGTLRSLRRQDSDTYDITAGTTMDGMAIDWIATTKIREKPLVIDNIRLIYRGQYSHDDVTQRISIYNYGTQSWEEIDNRIIGAETGDDTVVSAAIPTPLNHYISDDFEMRSRIHGRRESGSFTVWANSLSWDVVRLP